MTPTLSAHINQLKALLDIVELIEFLIYLGDTVPYDLLRTIPEIRVNTRKLKDEIAQLVPDPDTAVLTEGETQMLNMSRLTYPKRIKQLSGIFRAPVMVHFSDGDSCTLSASGDIIEGRCPSTANEQLQAFNTALDSKTECISAVLNLLKTIETMLLFNYIPLREMLTLPSIPDINFSREMVLCGDALRFMKKNNTLYRKGKKEKENEALITSVREVLQDSIKNLSNTPGAYGGKH